MDFNSFAVMRIPVFIEQILFGTVILIACIPKLTTMQAEISACPDKCERASGTAVSVVCDDSDRSRSSDTASHMLKLWKNSIDVRIILNPEYLVQPLASMPGPWKDSVMGQKGSKLIPDHLDVTLPWM